MEAPTISIEELHQLNEKIDRKENVDEELKAYKYLLKVFLKYYLETEKKLKEK